MSASQGQVYAPTSYPDGSVPTFLAGRSGEAINADLHGKFYTGAYRGKVFFASTAAAGTTIPISSATAATFVLYNPIGSGVNMELISYDSSVQSATVVVSSVMLGYAGNLIVAPTSVTALTPSPALVGSNAAPQGKVYSVATIVATTVFYELGAYGATSGAFPSIHHDFDGKFVLAPGSLAHVCGTAAQTSASVQTMVWGEWPL